MNKFAISVQLFCEMQPDWSRSVTATGFMKLVIENEGATGIQFSYYKG